MEEQTPFITTDFPDIEIANNPEQRCPCVLVLDCSGSMEGRQIDALNAAVLKFSDELRADELAAKRVEVSIVAFGNQVSVASDFCSAQLFYPEKLVAEGGTPMGEAICEAVRLIEYRKQILKKHGVPFYRPWLVLMTDGTPTDAHTQHWMNAMTLVSSGVASNKFTFFPLVTEDGNKSVVSQLCPNVQVRGLNSHKFSEFFLWLTRSLQTVARSQPGNKISLPDPSVWTINI